MRIDDDARLRARWAGRMTFDPTAATIAIEVAGVMHPMTWEAAAVQDGDAWVRTATTTELFVGSSVTPGADVQLPVGSHPAQVLISKADGEVIAVAADRLDVF